MKVSIITASFNSELSIADSINSVNGQTYDNIEHIFVDGKSTDNTLSIINEVSARNKKIISEKDHGIYDALNKGIDLATGDIIGIVHSDDFLGSKTVIEEIVRIFTVLGVEGVYGDLQYVSKSNPDKILRYWKSQPFQHHLLSRGWMPPHPTLFLKRSVYNNFGNFDLEYKIASDYDFILRLFKQEKLKFHYLPTVICKMRIGGASNKSLSNIILKSKEDLKALRQNKLTNPLLILIGKNLTKIPQFLSKS